MQDNRNLIITIVLTLLVLLGWEFFYATPKQKALDEARLKQAELQTEKISGTTPNPEEPQMLFAVPREEAVAGTGRVKIVSKELHGSINLKGARLDDLTLAQYRTTMDPASPEVVLFSPSNTEQVYFVELGYLASGVEAPGANTLWRANKATLEPGKPVTLTWQNKQGITFTRTISLDDNYLFTVEEKITNAGGAAIELSPYGIISRVMPHTEQQFILHEGPLGVFGGELEEVGYRELVKESKESFTSTGGWMGLSDKYWLGAMIPAQAETYTANFSHYLQDGKDRFQIDYLGKAKRIAPGESVTQTTYVYAGAKKVKLLDAYGEQLGVPLFDRAVDFGWFYFLTKPMFYVLDWLKRHLGAFGLAILAMTVLVKLVMFPLANKSYKSMAQMRRLHPEIMRLRELYKDDKARLNKEVMGFYAREKINPMAGCLPTLIQIPVFFALYKVLFVSIEMRHAPFYGWVHDLSAPDPTSIFNLFGLLPYDVPAWLHIGAWPILMGITMALMQKLNPPPADPIQKKVFAIMPYIFTFMFATFPAGLVIYWTWSNSLSIAQQYVITRILDKEAREKRRHAKAEKRMKKNKS